MRKLPHPDASAVFSHIPVCTLFSSRALACIAEMVLHLVMSLYSRAQSAFRVEGAEQLDVQGGSTRAAQAASQGCDLSTSSRSQPHIWAAMPGVQIRCGSLWPVPARSAGETVCSTPRFLASPYSVILHRLPANPLALHFRPCTLALGNNASG